MLPLLVLVWAGSFEIDRVADRLIPPAAMGIGAWQWKQLLWTSWWTLSSGGYLLVMHWFSKREPASQASLLDRVWKLSAAITLKFVVIDLLFFRISQSPLASPVLTGPRTLVGTVVVGCLILVHWLMAGPASSRSIHPSARAWMLGLAVATFFVLGSIDIDQAFINNKIGSTGWFTNPQHAEQVALSIFWSVFAIASVVSGFVSNTASLRYVGLALFAVVILKVLIVDSREISTGYRILSSIGLGLLLLGTSVLYGKLTPKHAASDQLPGEEPGRVF